MNEHKIIAAFDFDGTLSRGDSLPVFLRHALGTVGFLQAILRSSPWLIAHVVRLTDNHHAKQHLIGVALGGRKVEQVVAWGEEFSATRLPHMLRQGSNLAALREHQRQGHCCVMVSASPDVYLRPWAKALGFDALLCTELEIRDGRYSGRFVEHNCYGEEKVRRLNRWWGDSPPDQLYAYGDSRGDWEMLERADKAVYLDAPWKGRPR